MRADKREECLRTQGSIEVSMDCLKLRDGDGPDIQISVTGNQIYIGIEPGDDRRCWRNTIVDYADFVDAVARAFFGLDWRKPR